jgi:hypothetical protein
MEWNGLERERALSQILDVTCVPLDRIIQVSSEVDHAVERSLFVYRNRRLKGRKELRAALTRITDLTKRLLKSLDELDDELFETSRVDRVSIVGLLAALLDVPLRYVPASESMKQPHRPLGSTQNPALRMLILDLYSSIVEGAQGKLTLSKVAAEIKGTLPAVLKILRPFLPEVIPVNLPYETLRDIRKSAVRGQLQRSSRARPLGQ